MTLHEHNPESAPRLASAVIDCACRIAALPLTFATRLAFSGTLPNESTYLLEVQRHGGGCLDKALLLTHELRTLGLDCRFLLGGFGAHGYVSDEHLLSLLNGGNNSESSKHLQHVAVLVFVGDRHWLIDASGGRVGCLLASPAATDRLLAGELVVRCANLDSPLSYHLRSSALISRVFEEKLRDVRTVWQIVSRAGLAIEGCCTVRVFADELDRQWPRRSGCTFTSYASLDSLLQSGPDLQSLRSPELLQRAFERLEGERIISRKHLKFVVEKRSVPWGAKTEVVPTRTTKMELESQ